jgi:Flp pilus assembly protein TadG
MVFPLLLLLTFGLLEYGWLFMKVEQIENTARQAARVGATANAKTSEVNALVTSMMKDAGMNGKYTLTLTPGAIEGSPTGTMKKGDMLKVTISVPYSGNSGVRLIGVPLLPLPATIGSSITMTKEGPS